MVDSGIIWLEWPVGIPSGTRLLESCVLTQAASDLPSRPLMISPGLLLYLCAFTYSVPSTWNAFLPSLAHSYLSFETQFKCLWIPSSTIFTVLLSFLLGTPNCLGQPPHWLLTSSSVPTLDSPQGSPRDWQRLSPWPNSSQAPLSLLPCPWAAEPSFSKEFC